MKINFKVLIVTFLIALLMYPKTVEFLVNSGNDIITAKKLSTEMRQVNKSSVDPDKTKIVLIFDGGWSSVYTEAYELINRYDFKGSVSVIPSRIDEEEYMSYQQLSELYLNGWDLLNHSYSHRENIYDNSEELLSDFNKARQWMNNRYLGKCSDMIVLPYGEINPFLITMLKDTGYRNARTSDNVIVLDKNEIEYYPVTTINLSTEVTADDVKNTIDNIPDESKAVLMILNKIEDYDDGYDMTYSKEKLEQIITYLDQQSDKFQVVTYSQLFE